ncbi:hypothetical protein P4T04_05250 [Bacillus badius]|uniref:hypothetical protein n=1 Tax=Bacillus badius TaxID=1455 RepID=UPI00059782B2|nr:hypothetical protein [Bacillus badius]KZN99375.1 hypothetical protein A4244_18810 [Bacillus badius]MED0665724.1 hypothetical protein [Bacillus badius]OCS84964.1 hypothetical protein A6M11_18825 [Bacillus badius]OVE49225.1 hypothetical protein B1A98_16855 [Bacillus badius]TDW00845.1 hypothetical protein B0G66_11545 [Bacillus badius]
MNSTLKDQLQRWKRKNQVVEGRKSKRSKKKLAKRKEQPARKPESLSDSDLRYLMGTGRPTYKRHRGSFRQR